MFLESCCSRSVQGNSSPAGRERVRVRAGGVWGGLGLVPGGEKCQAQHGGDGSECWQSVPKGSSSWQGDPRGGREDFFPFGFVALEKESFLKKKIVFF